MQPNKLMHRHTMGFLMSIEQRMMKYDANKLTVAARQDSERRPNEDRAAPRTRQRTTGGKTLHSFREQRFLAVMTTLSHWYARKAS